MADLGAGNFVAPGGKNLVQEGVRHWVRQSRENAVAGWFNIVRFWKANGTRQFIGMQDNGSCLMAPKGQGHR